jgi:hypothetical protein
MGKPVVSPNAVRAMLQVGGLVSAVVAALSKLFELNPSVSWKETLFTIGMCVFAWTVDYERKNNTLPFVGGSVGASDDQLTTTLPGLGPVDGSGPSTPP